MVGLPQMNRLTHQCVSAHRSYLDSEVMAKLRLHGDCGALSKRILVDI